MIINIYFCEWCTGISSFQLCFLVKLSGHSMRFEITTLCIQLTSVSQDCSYSEVLVCTYKYNNYLTYTHSAIIIALQKKKILMQGGLIILAPLQCMQPGH